jgi:hypothetical protein
MTAKKKPTPTPRADERVPLVIRCLCEGLSREEITETVLASFPDGLPEPRSLDYLLDEARAVLRQDAQVDPEAAFGLSIRRFDDLYARALAAHDHRACLAIEKERVALLNLHPPAPPPQDQPDS